MPFFDPIRQGLSRFEGIPSHDELNRVLGLDDIRFVPQAPKTDIFEDGYEPRIFLKGEVQTRENSWHDFFNALVWHSFPNTKRTINSLQYQHLKQRYPRKRRLPAENMLTLFDENGAVVLSKDPELLDLIKEHRWHELFWKRRNEV